MILILMFASFYLFLMMVLVITLKNVRVKYRKFAKFYAFVFGFLFIIMLFINFPIYETKKINISSRQEILARDFSKESVMKKANLKESVLLEAPHILQYPELPRGCEVTSLAMMLQYAGVSVDKMELAEKVKKEPYRESFNGVTYAGDPNVGFVGDIYGQESGYGVYHAPIVKLAEKYLPNQIIDITGQSFNNVLYQLDKGKPVWVIVSSRYKKLPENEFKTWNTKNGKVQITFRLHSVLLTGYDEQFVYFNDPLSVEKNRRVKINNFKESWIQMGSQAITYHLASE